MIKNFSKNSIITYYILVVLFQDVLYPSINYEIVEEIKEGKLSFFLLKPLSYPIYHFFLAMGTNITYFLSSLLLTTAFVVLLGIKIVFPSWERLLYFVMALGLSYILGFLLSFVFSILSFWTTEISGIRIILDSLIPFFSGMLLPVSFFPIVLKFVVKIFPFWLIINLPIEIYIGSIPDREIAQVFGLQIMWIGVVSIILKILWNVGRKKYTAVGG